MPPMSPPVYAAFESWALAVMAISALAVLLCVVLPCYRLRSRREQAKLCDVPAALQPPLSELGTAQRSYAYV